MFRAPSNFQCLWSCQENAVIVFSSETNGRLMSLLLPIRKERLGTSMECVFFPWQSTHWICAYYSRCVSLAWCELVSISQVQMQHHCAVQMYVFNMNIYLFAVQLNSLQNAGFFPLSWEGQLYFYSGNMSKILECKL